MPRPLPPDIVAAILDEMARGSSVQEILIKTGASTTVFYRVIKMYPLWAHRFQKDNPDA